MSISRNGFTLIELLVVILIIGILATVAMPQYQKAVERTRMTEAITLLDTISKAQQRNVMQVGGFSNDFATLDVAPQGAAGPIYYTKGDPVTGENGNGFEITMYMTNELGNGYAEATRFHDEHPLTYNYKLRRIFLETTTTCFGSDENGQALCADFCGIETPTAVCCSDGTANVCYEENRLPPPEEDEEDEYDDDDDDD